MSYRRVEGVVSVLLMIGGVIVMVWSGLLEQAGITPIAIVGLLMFGVGILLGIDRLLTLFDKMRKMKSDSSPRYNSQSLLSP